MKNYQKPVVEPGDEPTPYGIPWKDAIIFTESDIVAVAEVAAGVDLLAVAAAAIVLD